MRRTMNEAYIDNRNIDNQYELESKMRFRWDALLWVLALSAMFIGSYISYFLSFARVIPFDLSVNVIQSEELYQWPIEFGEYSRVTVYSASTPVNIRLIQFVSHLMIVSVVVMGFALAAFVVMQIRRASYAARLVARFVAFFGAWVILATVASEIFRVVFVMRAVDLMGLPTDVGEVVSIKLPEFALTANVLFAFSVGSVLIIGAMAIRRSIWVERELESVI